MSTTIRRCVLHALTLLAVALVAGATLTVVPAATPSAEAVTLRTGIRVVQVAASRKGAPYKWGAEGPRKFDCSGLAQWSYRRVGKSIPRVTRDQYRAALHIRKHARRRGDLVFFHRGRRARSIYHVGIYAGRGRIWHAPHTGARVRKEHIWTRKVWYARVR
jgi:cell wall-associated NlpC family hydrolase